MSKLALFALGENGNSLNVTRHESVNLKFN